MSDWSKTILLGLTVTLFGSMLSVMLLNLFLDRKALFWLLVSFYWIMGFILVGWNNHNTLSNIVIIPTVFIPVFVLLFVSLYYVENFSQKFYQSILVGFQPNSNFFGQIFLVSFLTGLILAIVSALSSFLGTFLKVLLPFDRTLTIESQEEEFFSKYQAPEDSGSYDQKRETK
jgi:hypothetical protein